MFSEFLCSLFCRVSMKAVLVEGDMAKISGKNRSSFNIIYMASNLNPNGIKTWPKFTQEECLLLGRTWCRDLEDVEQVSSTLYATMFEKDPEIFQFFKAFNPIGNGEVDTSNLSRDEITTTMNSLAFKRMSVRSVQTIAKAVMQLADLTVVHDELLFVGHLHYRYTLAAQQPLTDRHWEVMRESMYAAMLQHVTGLCEREQSTVNLAETMPLWSTLLNYIVDCVRSGYIAEKRLQEQNNHKTKDRNAECCLL